MKIRGAGQRRPPSDGYTIGEWTRGYLAWIAVLPLYLLLWAFASVFKRLPPWMLRKLLRSHTRTTEGRKCDVRIPGDFTIPAYMLRWWKTKRNAFFNVYYHIVRRSDDDTALHDHPWWNFSIVLEGTYYEHLIERGGVHKKTKYGPGAVRFRRSGNFAHRLYADAWICRTERSGRKVAGRKAAAMKWLGIIEGKSKCTTDAWTTGKLTKRKSPEPPIGASKSSPSTRAKRSLKAS
jgi:hypothetical protein